MTSSCLRVSRYADPTSKALLIILKAERKEFLKSMRYIPAQNRGRPTVIEAKVTLPPKSKTIMVVEIDRAYLRYTDYPPDAMRGFDVPSGVVVVLDNNRRMYTTSTLLDMPTPDFSMPYNVIIMTSTVIALFFGSVFNLLTRTWLLVDLRDDAVPDALTETAEDGHPEGKEGNSNGKVES